MHNSPQPHDIERRAAEPTAETPRRCIAIGCHRLTQRSARNGLSDTLCKRHVEFVRRHGSHWRRSYLRAELEPYRKAAQRWLKDRRADPHIARVVAALDGLLDGSGKPNDAYAVRWDAPEEKARVALARLRAVGVSGRRLLEIVLTIKATQSALGPRGNPEFRDVQIAKLAHRLASGTHIKSALYGDRSKYPRAEGNAMRILGHRIEDKAGIAATDEAVDEVVSLAAGSR